MLFKNNIIQLAISFIVIFNLVFPKGGMKVNDVPITIGLMSLLALLFVGGMSSVIRFKIYMININRLKILFSWIPFQVWMLIIVNENGYENLGMLLSLFLNFLILPWLMLFFNGDNFDKNIEIKQVMKIIKYGIWFLIIYGLVNHGYKVATDSYIEIPFLTVNYDDVGRIYEKDNGRGVFGKLVSTYQNGNLFGISMLLLLPLFCYLDKKRWHQLVLELTLFLTLSRTIWLGIVFYEIVSNIGRKIYVKKVLYLVGILVLIIVGVMNVMDSLGLDVEFLLDSSLGGRIDQSSFAVYNVIPTVPFATISEIVYMGVLNNFGLVGLFLFCFGFFSPAYIYRRGILKKNTLQNSLVMGLIVYYFICLGDGAILLIPVMLFYWFIVLFLTSTYVAVNDSDG